MEKLLFVVFGFLCKAVFHIIALIIAYQYSIRIFCILIGIWIIHNIISLVAVKYRRNWFKNKKG